MLSMVLPGLDVVSQGYAIIMPLIIIIILKWL